MTRHGLYLPRSARLRKLTPTADEALLGGEPLTVSQVQSFRGWVGQCAMGSSTVEDAVADKVIPLNAEKWSDYLRDSPGLQDLVANRTGITRRDVSQVALESLRTRKWTPLFTASYAWGQGLNGYGPSRLSRIVATAAQRDIDLEVTLAEAVAAMREGAATDGYARLRGALPWFGPAFFTKFLYFAGAVAPPAKGPAPLILDAVVAKQLRAVVASRLAQLAPNNEAGAKADTLAEWLWSDGGWTVHRYGVWLDFAEKATDQLSREVAGWPKRTDTFEFAVFSGQLEP